MAQINENDINFDEYTPEVFISMMSFLRERLSNCAPLTSHYEGYTYVFKTSSDKQQFDTLISRNREQAMLYVFDKWKEGADLYFEVNVISGLSNKVMYGTTGHELKYVVTTKGDGSETHEPITVNYTFECGGSELTLQESYPGVNEQGQPYTVTLNIDKYLREGTNNITITIRDRNNKVTPKTEYITYEVGKLTIQSTFNIATIFDADNGLSFDVKVEGNPDDGENIKVEYCIDGSANHTEETIRNNDIGKNITQSLSITSGTTKRTLQMRAKAVVGGETRYSKVLYYEFVTSNVTGRAVLIAYELDQTAFVTSSSALTIACKQYVLKTVKWAFYSSSAGDKATVNWSLVSESGESQNVGNMKLGEDTAVNDGSVYDLTFVAFEYGEYTLKATIGSSTIASYNTNIVENTDIQEETNGLSLRLTGTNRDNGEDASVRNQWTYKNITSSLTGMDWNQRNGWYNDALNLLGGKLEVNIKPFAHMTENSSGMALRIVFETFNAVNTDAVVFQVGERIKITANTATFKSVGGTTLVDKFPSNTKMTLCFVVHPRSGSTVSEPRLMEIINGGISSRLVNYPVSDTFLDMTSKIVAGNTSQCGIRIYSIRCYSTDINTKSELDNTIIDSDDVASMYENNNIYDSRGNIIVKNITDRIPCLAITGKGGVNVLQTIWDYTDEVNRPIIYVDAEWTNPSEPESNWTIENMRLRGHGQSTMKNPMKSLKAWLKNDDSDNQYTTRFYPKGIEDESEDHRWSMKSNAHPANKFVFQCYYVDSSNSKSPTILSLYDKVSRAANILTPSQKYAIEQYPSAMGAAFPLELRQAPDSIPCVVISRDTVSSAWKYEGIFVLMDDKKSDYIYGERSIYDANNDPFCYLCDKNNQNVLWDNSNVTRFEFKSNNHPIASMTNLSYIQSKFYAAKQAYVETEFGEEAVATLTEGGDTSGENNGSNYEFENALEIIYPDYDDFYKKDGVTFNDTKYRKHTDKLYNLAVWVATCWQNGGINSSKFRSEANKHLDLEKWALYYIFFRAFGAFDSPVRNMQLTTMEVVDGFDVWFPIPWDWDIAFGTVNTGPLVFDNPPIDRQTQSGSDYAFRGHDNAIWNMLENWTVFRKLVSSTLDKISEKGFTYNGIIEVLTSYAYTWPEALHNESENTKYKQVYLNDPSNKEGFLAYNLGRGVEFMKWWLKINFDALCAEFAAGDFVSTGISFRGQNGYNAAVSYHFSVTYGQKTHFGWALGNDKQVTSSGDYSVEVNADTKLTITLPHSPSNSEYTTIYSGPYIKVLDITEFGYDLDNINLGNLYNTSTGTMCEELYLGVPSAKLAQGVRNNNNSYTLVGLNNLTSLRILQMQGFANIGSLDISNLSALTHIYAKGSGYTTIDMPSSAQITVAELPASMNAIKLDRTTIASLKFFDKQTLAETAYPTALRKAEFIGLGSDTTVKSMVLAWLQNMDYNELLESCTLTIGNVAWNGLSFDDIIRISKVGNLSMTGTLQMTGLFTSEQTSKIISAYPKDKFGDVLGDGALRIRCSDSGLSIGLDGAEHVNGKWQVYAGNEVQFTAVVFGNSNTPTIMYTIDSGTLQSGNTVCVYNNSSIGVYTGKLTVEESTTGDYDMTVNIQDLSSGSLTTVPMRIKKRVYPTDVRINPTNEYGTALESVNGKIQITSQGYYYFRTVFTVNGAENAAFRAGQGIWGNFKPSPNGYKWTYNETNDQQSVRCTVTSHHSTQGTEEYLFCLQVKSLPDSEVVRTLDYWAQFIGNNDKVTATQIQILLLAIVNVIGNLTDVMGGNVALYNTIVAKGITASNAPIYTNVDLKRLNATFAIPSTVTSFKTKVTDSSGGTTTLLDRYVLDYLTNVTHLDLSSASSFSEDVNVEKMQFLQQLNCKGSAVANVSGMQNKAMLTKVYFSYVNRSIKVSNCPNLHFRNLSATPLSRPVIPCTSITATYDSDTHKIILTFNENCDRTSVVYTYDHTNISINEQTGLVTRLTDSAINEVVTIKSADNPAVTASITVTYDMWYGLQTRVINFSRNDTTNTETYSNDLTALDISVQPGDVSVVQEYAVISDTDGNNIYNKICRQVAGLGTADTYLLRYVSSNITELYFIETGLDNIDKIEIEFSILDAENLDISYGGIIDINAYLYNGKAESGTTIYNIGSKQSFTCDGSTTHYRAVFQGSNFVNASGSTIGVRFTLYSYNGVAIAIHTIRITPNQN